MKKQEFLNTLRIALNGKLSPAEVEENVSYYEDYINTQMRIGKSEQEVIAALGDPRLIARSIAEVAGHDEEPSGEQSEQNTKEQTKRRFRLPGWLWVFLIVFVVVLILCAIFSVLWALLPILIPIMVVFVIINMIRKSR